MIKQHSKRYTIFEYIIDFKNKYKHIDRDIYLGWVIFVSHIEMNYFLGYLFPRYNLITFTVDWLMHLPEF